MERKILTKAGKEKEDDQEKRIELKRKTSKSALSDIEKNDGCPESTQFRGCLYNYLVIVWNQEGLAIEGKLSLAEVTTMAGYKGSTELAKLGQPGYLAPFEEMERWFDTLFSSPLSLLSGRAWPEPRELAEFQTLSPRVDIFEEGKEVVLKADMPGIEKKDIDITVADNMLTISGEKMHEATYEKGSYVRCERTHGSFFRRFELPSGIDADKIKAHMDNGVLELRLPRTEESKGKSKKISVS